MRKTKKLYYVVTTFLLQQNAELMLSCDDF